MKPTNSIILSCQSAMTQYARSELLTADGQAGEFTPLDEETYLVHTKLSFEKLSALFLKQRPVFIRHIHPADLCVPLTDAPLQAIMESAVSFLPNTEKTFPAEKAFSTEKAFSVQCRVLDAHSNLKPYDINRSVSELFITHGAVLNVKEPQQVISITVAENVAYMGLSETNRNLSAWAGGRMRFAREEGQLSRAEFKLLEAMEVFSFTVEKNSEVLDLGAAPGGWSRICLKLGARVTAVDPAELDESIRQKVQHFRMTTQEFLNENTQSFDYILNDMRMEPEESAELIARFYPFLKNNGTVVLTLKLFGDQPRRQMLRALSRLQDYFTVVGVRQLFHNRSEVTVILKK